MNAMKAKQAIDEERTRKEREKYALDQQCAVLSNKEKETTQRIRALYKLRSEEDIQPQKELIKRECLAFEQEREVLMRRISILNADIVSSYRSTTTTMKDVFEGKFKSEVEEYSKVVCRRFCLSFYSSLPRELRDLVYGYLSHGDIIEVVRDTKGDLGYRNVGIRPRLPYWRPKGAIDTYVKRAGAMRAEHFWNDEYTSKNMVLELTEVWTKKSTFILAHDMLPEFLRADISETSISYAETVAEISVRASAFPISKDEKLCQMLLFLDNIEVLFQLANKHAILGFLFQTIRPGEGDFFDEALELVFPTLTRLHEAGFHIAVTFENQLSCDFSPEVGEFSLENWLQRLKIWREPEPERDEEESDEDWDSDGELR
ncbi:hypothetical protein K505DRAFT_379179 [Melanomma pulvis-pyrius CBS 109.77]|uniref:Uncharacterized protein n=1 Tax=Melanomma pulvis-pyrius CBS 109.77 TaxID=1314802 RepID=A0A6A6WVD0_9PLEO|nr:hypothetical protein K505DRAFT_379179 [Melanomma pulvis-pyrius CBS 109.77]